MVIGYVAVKTGSLLPGMLYHAVHNGLSVCIGRLPLDAVHSQPLLRAIFEPGSEAEQLQYRLPAAALAAVVAIAILLWFKRLPYRLSAEEQLQEAMQQASGGAHMLSRNERAAGVSPVGLIPSIRA